MEKDLIVGVLCFFVGFWAIYASVKNKSSFFNSFKASIFVGIFGRNGARIFYGLLGVCIVILSIKILFDYFTK